MIDLRQAIKVREMQYNKEMFKIGFITGFDKDFPYNGKRDGQVVLFRDLSIKEKTCTIEQPMPDEWIARNRAENNHLTTFYTCLNFPLKYIQEVIV